VSYCGSSAGLKHSRLLKTGVKGTATAVNIHRNPNMFPVASLNINEHRKIQIPKLA
jgi:hypothetical protein